MYNTSSFNSAYVGSNTFGEAMYGRREQQIVFGDSKGFGPKTDWASVHMPISKINSGLGLAFTQDQIGFEHTFDLRLQYAYHFKLGEGKLGIGVDLGVVNYQFSLEDAVYPNALGSGNSGQSDPWLKSKFDKGDGIWKFQFGAGVFYRNKNIYLGLSSTQINEPKFDIDNDDISYVSRTYWLTAGYKYQTSNPLWVIKPSALIKANFNAENSLNSVAQISLDLMFQYNKFVIAGVTYTSASDISPVVGVEINNGSKLDGLRALVAYDLTWSALRAGSSGSFEFMIGYSFNLSIEKVTKSYKSVRFL
jgi:type IX secretion system PorP/SprF family membrane protein